MGAFDGQEWVLSKGQQAGGTYGCSSLDRAHLVSIEQSPVLDTTLLRLQASPVSSSTGHKVPGRLPTSGLFPAQYLAMLCLEHLCRTHGCWRPRAPARTTRETEKHKRNLPSSYLSPYPLLLWEPHSHRRVRKLAVKLYRSRRVAVKSWPGLRGTLGARKVTASSSGTSWYCGGSAG